MAAELGLVVGHVHADLRERRFGCFEGLTREEVAVRHPEAWQRYVADPGPAPPGGESREELLGRLLPAVSAAAARLAGPLLVVMHGGSMRALLAAHVGDMPRPSSASWPLHGIQNGHVFRVTLSTRGSPRRNACPEGERASQRGRGWQRPWKHMSVARHSPSSWQVSPGAFPPSRGSGARSAAQEGSTPLRQESWRSFSDSHPSAHPNPVTADAVSTAARPSKSTPTPMMVAFEAPDCGSSMHHPCVQTGVAIP